MPLRLKEGVGDVPQLRRDALHAQALVAEVLSGQHIDLRERLVVAHEVEGFLGREDEVQALGELLEQAA